MAGTVRSVADVDCAEMRERPRGSIHRSAGQSSWWVELLAGRSVAAPDQDAARRGGEDSRLTNPHHRQVHSQLRLVDGNGATHPSAARPLCSSTMGRTRRDRLPFCRHQPRTGPRSRLCSSGRRRVSSPDNSQGTGGADYCLKLCSLVRITVRASEATPAHKCAKHLCCYLSSGVHGRHRGHHGGTALRYASYSGPNCRVSVGSSYQRTNDTNAAKITSA
jgi:hypothetical protein